jgi:hypothetical protein
MDVQVSSSGGLQQDKKPVLSIGCEIDVQVTTGTWGERGARRQAVIDRPLVLA